MTRYTIYNPSTARRIIHSGGEVSRTIEIRPRSSVENVELADHVAIRLLDLAKDTDNELQLTEFKPAPEQKIPAMKMTVKEEGVTVVKGRR
jgi:hypothetical protein